MTYGDAIFARYWAEHSLPAGYRRVEYLESTGAQWIDTKLNNFTDVTYKMRMKWTSTTGNAQHIGQGNGWFFGIVRSLLWRVPTDGGSGIPPENIPIANIGTWYAVTFRRDTAGASLAVDDYSYSSSGIRVSSNENAWLFAISGSGNAGFKCCCAVSYTQLYSNGALVRNFIPCVRESDNKPGLYDLCGSICSLTGTPFYINSGTGADFTWGELQ